MMADSGVVQIDASYLTNTLKPALQGILDEVNDQLAGLGPSTDPQITEWLYPVDQNLAVQAGGTPGSNGSSSFNAAADLNTALKSMGTSVHDQLTWLRKVLNDMINEITTTVNSFSHAESLNGETVDQLINDFQTTINDMGSPPGSSSGSSSS
jgi:hypothetical protein